MLEGNCDEARSAEYNVGLGDRARQRSQEFLSSWGVWRPAEDRQLRKERPVCSEANESCWQKNRHVHFSPGIRAVQEARHTPGGRGLPFPRRCEGELHMFPRLCVGFWVASPRLAFAASKE